MCLLKPREHRGLFFKREAYKEKGYSKVVKTANNKAELYRSSYYQLPLRTLYAFLYSRHADYVPQDGDCPWQKVHCENAAQGYQ